MNIRIEEQAIRFKITEGELGQLLNGEELGVNALISARIVPNDNGDDISVDNEEGLVLSVPSHKLLELFEMGRSRVGLAAQQGDLSLSLQVDVRKDSRPRAK